MPNTISSYCIFLIVIFHKACDRYARKHKYTREFIRWSSPGDEFCRLIIAKKLQNTEETLYTVIGKYDNRDDLRAIAIAHLAP